MESTGKGCFSLIKFNLKYFLTVPGACKLIQLVIGIICMLLASPFVLVSTFWFLIVIAAFISTFVWSIIYLFGIQSICKLPLSLHWIKTEFFHMTALTLGYVIAFIVHFAVWTSRDDRRGPNIAAAVFGIVNSIVYGLSSYFLYKDYRKG